MTERNRSTVYVCFRTVETEIFFHRQVLCRKCFVDLDQIDLT